MNTHGDSTDINYNAVSSPLSDLGGEPKMDIGNDYVEIEDVEWIDGEPEEERIVQEDGSVVIRIKKKKIKKITRKRVKKDNAEGANSTTKLVSMDVDAIPTATTVHGVPEGAITSGKWDSGLFGCFEHCVPNCFMATFCPCFTAAQVASRIGFSYWHVLGAFFTIIAIDYICWIVLFATMHSTDLESESDGFITYYYYESSTTFTAWGYISTLLSLLAFVILWQLRTKVRERYQLPGGCVEDFFVSCCCSCCSLAQMATHTKSYKPGSCDFGPPHVLPAYSDA